MTDLTQAAMEIEVEAWRRRAEAAERDLELLSARLEESLEELRLANEREQVVAALEGQLARLKIVIDMMEGGSSTSGAAS
ncbi:hypothetical protein [Billgrantia aerodenitrificans]|jgi:hypothetical protein|uniref:DUF904 domain-containing protein n=1 Tax=Billgrantia aerodenitrificans TaxID=2733483 RepID=A0ABS9AVU1_9GAMM|nr:hypothetical protein [Halomonas aerodenitrificans]MCE8025829.1 hypothetical protein [Halomonas aerodenitrificans]